MTDRWPTPPPFLQYCTVCISCVAMLEVAHAERDAETCYLRHYRVELALHIAVVHPDDVPGRHDDCRICDHLSRSDADERVVRAHQAGSLFLPPRLARLL